MKNYNILPSNYQIIKNTELLQLKNLLLNEKNFYYILEQMKQHDETNTPTTQILISSLKQLDPGAQLQHKVFAGRVIYSILPRREKSGLFKAIQFLREAILPIKNKPFQEKIANELIKPAVAITLKKNYVSLLAEARLNYRKKFVWYKKKRRRKSKPFKRKHTMFGDKFFFNIEKKLKLDRIIRKKLRKLQRRYNAARKKWSFFMKKVMKENKKKLRKNKYSNVRSNIFGPQETFNLEAFNLQYQNMTKKIRTFLSKNFKGLDQPPTYATILKNKNRKNAKYVLKKIWDKLKNPYNKNTLYYKGKKILANNNKIKLDKLKTLIKKKFKSIIIK
jgi:hypothetical protein